MIIVRSIERMTRIAASLKRKGKRIGFVPTMGALHAGHLSLIRKARKENDAVVVSIFVNPIQFGPKEDFTRYPRDLSADSRLCRSEGVDIIFYPDFKKMYPCGYRTYAEVQGLSEVLCGSARPGHFRGVATVVIKLLNIVQPAAVYFGQKDAQQAIIIKTMVKDLNIPAKVKVLPTVRERDGLAMSSRNVYLTARERKSALALSGALRLARHLLKIGTRDAQKIITEMQRFIQRERSAKIEYISIVDLKHLRPAKRIDGRYLVALAVRIGKTRLIDNVIL